MKLPVHALHGFLGKPDDWACEDWIRWDLFSEEMRHLEGLTSWAAWFNQQIDEPSLIVGYSMGARLAMHALLDRPSLWRGAVLISGSYGLSSDVERDAKLNMDQRWALRFRNDNWESLIDDWDRQPVFAHDPKVKRTETDYTRESLANRLLDWSCGKQVYLKEKLESLDIPIFWISGELDQSARKQAEALKLKDPKSKIWIANSSGHRIPWSKPEVMNQKIQQFFSEVTDDFSYRSLDTHQGVSGH